MRAIGGALVLLLALASVARADGLDLEHLVRRAEAAMHSLFGPPSADPEVIRPPAGIDPQMVITPRRAPGTPIIRPPGERR